MTKILLVEDNEMNQDMLSRRLSRRGFELTFAMDGKVGIEQAIAEQPDLILMDMSLPVMDGWEATRLIKQDRRTAHIPVIALTAHAMVGDREKTLEAGCDDYDTKPVELARLLSKIEALLNSSPKKAAPLTSSAPRVSQSSFDDPANLYRSAISTSVSIPSFPKPESISGLESVASLDPSSEEAEFNSGLYQILVVDDNEMNRDMLGRRLQRAGYEVVLAESGEDGLGIIHQQAIHLVVLDVMMPGMSGLEMLQHIRSTHSSHQLPVIMATAKDKSEDVVHAFDLGANDYVTKPLDLPVLLARIQSHLRLAKFQIPPTTARSPLFSDELTMAKSFTDIQTQPEIKCQGSRIKPSAISSRENLYKIPHEAIEKLSRIFPDYTAVKLLEQTPWGRKILVAASKASQKPHYILEEFHWSSESWMLLEKLHNQFQMELNLQKKMPQTALVASLREGVCDNHSFYLVYDRVQGQALSDCIKAQKPLLLRNIINLTIKLLNVVREMHEQGIICKTLQPKSFICQESDHCPVLANNGILDRLKLTADRPETKASEFYMYVAPELLTAQATFASDVYSVGTIVLEALTDQTTQAIPRDPQTGLIDWQKIVTVGGGFDAILEKMVQPDPARRYTCVKTVLDDIYRLPLVSLFQRYQRPLGYSAETMKN